MSEPIVLSRSNAAELRKALEIREVDGPVIGAVDHGGTNPRFGVFDWAGNPLLMRPGTDEIMAENVTDLTFTYYDANDDTTSDLDAIRTVDIRMTIEKSAGRDGQVSRTLIKRVKCRNLEFN